MHNRLDFSKLIRPPGEGLLTFTTGSGRAQKKMSPYFKKSDYLNWSKKKRISKNLNWGLIGAPSDCGGGVCRGAAHGPLGIREVLFKKNKNWSKIDLGDIPCIPHLLEDSMLSPSQLQASGKALWGKAYRDGFPVSPLNLLEEYLVFLLKKYPNFKPLVLGGDHSLSGAVFNALFRAKRLKNCGVIHIDAHTDLLESRFGVRDCFATWTSHALLHFKNPKAWVQLGIRASGRDKNYWQDKFGLKQYWAKELIHLDPRKCAEKISFDLKKQKCTKLYITNDIDGTDSKCAPATGTPEEKGLDPEWLKIVLKVFVQNFELIGADIMEVAPVLGDAKGSQKTLKVATQYIQALGILP